MKIHLNLLVIVCLLMSGCAAIGSQSSEFKGFPVAKEGMDRFVIQLLDLGRAEDECMVEIIAGKHMFVDGVNWVGLDSRINTHSIKEKEWLNYYEISGSSEITTTFMAVPPYTPKVKEFVTAPSIKVRYDSRYPIVVYAPENYEVQYRICSVSDQTFQAKKR